MKKLLVLTLLLAGCRVPRATDEGVRPQSLTPPPGRAVAAFAEGCFWCTEEVFEAVAGVDSAVSGYAGGHTHDPTYERVNTETTGHAESVLVYYDPRVVPYAELVKVFYASHDPTTPNRQGPDRGSSYRSILFYRTPEEKTIAEQLSNAEGERLLKPLATEIKELTAFYRAEGYHQDYVQHHPLDPYVLQVSRPRYEKFRQLYKGRLRE